MATLLHDVVRVERDGAVVTVTIAHPPANAISRAVVSGIAEALEQAEADATVRAVVLTGDGPRFFAAGADVTEFLDAEGAAIAAGLDLTEKIEASSLPVIAAVNGMAFGGGCEIALACDLRICSTVASFGQPEINLGIIPGWGGTQRLPRLIGVGHAAPLLFSGEPIDSATALRLGLVAAVVEPGDLAEAAQSWAKKLAAKAPLALAATKRALHGGAGLPLAEALRVERALFVEVFGTDDAREGVTAFLEKRPATWQGR